MFFRFCILRKLGFLLIITSLGISGLYGMDERLKKIGEIQGQSGSSFYMQEESELIDLVFLKTLDNMIYLKNGTQTMLKIDLDEAPRLFCDTFRIFFDPDGSLPEISHENYLKRIRQFFRCSASCYVVAYMYIQRLTEKYGRDIFNHFTFHRIFLTSIVIAVRITDDLYRSSSYCARVGGIDLNEMLLLEKRFLSLMDLGNIEEFKLTVSKEDYEKFVVLLRDEKLRLRMKYKDVSFVYDI